MTGLKLTEQAVRKTAKVVRQVLRPLPSGARGDRGWRVLPDRRCQGKLDGDLSAGSFTSPTTATMTVWQPDPDDTATPPDFVATDLVLTVVNRDPSLAGETGAVIKAEFLNGEWSPYWVGCVE